MDLNWKVRIDEPVQAPLLGFAPRETQFDEADSQQFVLQTLSHSVGECRAEHLVRSQADETYFYGKKTS